LRELVPGLLFVKEHPERLAGGRFLTRMTVMRLGPATRFDTELPGEVG
jgi:hypothetical protein